MVTPVEPAVRAGAPARRRGSDRGVLSPAAAGAVLVTGAYLLGRDGSPGWQVGRVVGFVALAAAVGAVARAGGRAMDFGWYGDRDVMAAVDLLVARPDVDADRIAVVGMSMGGEEAVGAAAADPRIAAVVAEGATSRTARDKAWLSARYGWRGAVQEGIEWLTYELTDLLTAADPPITLRDAVAVAAPTPVLLIAGGGTTDEEHAARHIQSGSPATVEVWVAPGSAHTAALDDHPEEWRRRVSAFLASALAAG